MANYGPSGSDIFSAIGKALGAASDFSSGMNQYSKQKAMAKLLAELGVGSGGLPTVKEDLPENTSFGNVAAMGQRMENFPVTNPKTGVSTDETRRIDFPVKNFDLSPLYINGSPVNREQFARERTGDISEENAIDRYSKMSPEELMRLMATRRAGTEDGSGGGGGDSFQDQFAKSLALAGTRTPFRDLSPSGQEMVNWANQAMKTKYNIGGKAASITSEALRTKEQNRAAAAKLPQFSEFINSPEGLQWLLSQGLATQKSGVFGKSIVPNFDSSDDSALIEIIKRTGY